MGWFQWWFSMAKQKERKHNWPHFIALKKKVCTIFFTNITYNWNNTILQQYWWICDSWHYVSDSKQKWNECLSSDLNTRRHTCTLNPPPRPPPPPAPPPPLTPHHPPPHRNLVTKTPGIVLRNHMNLHHQKIGSLSGNQLLKKGEERTAFCLILWKLGAQRTLQTEPASTKFTNNNNTQQKQAKATNQQLSQY